MNTPEIINYLEPNEIFVFGSNEAGIHGGGAAKTAQEKFGAIYGVPFGLMGQSFAIPTKDENIETLPLSSIQNYLVTFINFAIDNPQLKFYLTKIGCGLAGYTTNDIKSILWKAVDSATNNGELPQNIIIPVEFER
jgi:hypothetical protein